MPSSPFATGPCDFFVTSKYMVTPQYLGASEKGPHIQFRRESQPFYVDLGGSVSFDEIYGGVDALVSIDLLRFDWSILAAIENVPVPAIGPNPWLDIPGDIGSMNMVEGNGITVWIRFNHASKPPFAAASMPVGLRFPVCKVMNESWEDLAPPNAVKIPLVIHAQRLFDPTYVSATGLGYGRWILADNDLSAIAGRPIT
jgi:hypothetical protein